MVAVRRLAFAGVLACLAMAVPIAQAPLARDDRPFRSGIELTSITATVTDSAGRLVTGLDRDTFEVFEDGIRQEITQFTRERVPVGLGVLLDISDSMFGQRIQDARAAVHRFLFELLDSADEFFILAFNHTPKTLTGWTHTTDDVTRALNGLRPFGGTAAYDAVVEALPMIERRARQRAALLIISDGADTASNVSMRDVKSALLTLYSPHVVAVVNLDSLGSRGLPRLEIAGESSRSPAAALVETASARIADELNHQYVLGYTPTHAADGRYHSLRVRIAGSEYKVRARNGYVATPARGRI